MYWNISVITLCFLLLLFIVWIEVRRANKAFLPARIIASILAVISFACLVLPLTIKQKQDTDISSIVLLTEGFNNDSVRSFLASHKNVKVYALEKNMNAFNATYIPDITFVSGYNAKAKAIHVFGYGLDEDQLSRSKGNSLVFHASEIKNSVTSVDWRHTLKSGEPLHVQGQFDNTSSSPVKIVLSGFHTSLDSVNAPAKQMLFFQLTTTPKQLDRAIYSLTVLSGRDTIENEPVPVEVVPSSPLGILILAAAPDFENKFLQNWLEKSEYKFAGRTTISKDKYDKAFINLSPVSLDHITPSLLEKFDVVIADNSALSQLPAADIASLKSYIENKGVGLIVRTDNVKSTTFYSNSFPLVQTQDSIEHELKLVVSDNAQPTHALKVEQPIHIQALSGAQPLVKDQQHRTFVSSKMYGLGKVILTTLDNTYTWQLAGNATDYANYWTNILQKAAKQTFIEQEWSITPSMPRKDEEVYLQLQTTKSTIPQAQIGDEVAYMQQNMFLPYQWTANYWPHQSGWQPIISEDGKSTWLYVYNNTDWKGIRASKRINATKKFEADHKNISQQTSIIEADTPVEIPKIYFFIVFIICSGFLWFERKFSNQ